MTGGFPASHRLKIKAQFDWVFGRPNQRCSHGVLQAIYKPARYPALTDSVDRRNPEEKPPVIKELNISDRGLETMPGARLGLIVAKRFLPLAVDRNRLKRLIREAFRNQRQDLPDVDIIVRLLRRPKEEVSAGEVALLFGKMQRPSHPPGVHRPK